jgi:predicted nucleic acid-binding protein
MAVVIDANVLVAISVDDDRNSVARQRIEEWATTREDIHAPSLARFEVASAFTRLFAAKMVSMDEIQASAALIEAKPVIFHPLRDIPEVIRMASRLGRNSAYDAAYLVLAEELNAELWTFDGPLARNALSCGFRVQLLSPPR